MKRFGKPEELDGTLLYLLREKMPEFVMSVVVPVDGGFSDYSWVKVSAIEEKNKRIEELSADNERLKAERSAAYQRISKIRILCEDLV